MMHGPRPITILMAEDDPDDRMLTERALRENRLANSLRFVKDGIELLAYLRHEDEYAVPESAPTPDLILLDLNMPRMDGREALMVIKSDPALRHIPVVVLTTSQADEDILGSYDLGVNSYITKPVTFKALVKLVRLITQYWIEIVELPVAPPRAHPSTHDSPGATRD